MTFKVTKTKMQQGMWHGVVTGGDGAEPKIEVRHENTRLTGVILDHDLMAGHWTLTIPIPPSAIADGVQTLIIHDGSTDQIIGHISLMTDDATAEDMRIEMDLMRAELDMLKRAFRRHCAETV